MELEPIKFSKRQIKSADRIPGIELLLPWPDELGPPPVMEQDTERDATPRETAWIDARVQPACAAHGLVAGHALVVGLYGPRTADDPLRSEGWVVQTRLLVVVIGRRWIGARGATVDRTRRQVWYGAAS